MKHFVLSALGCALLAIGLSAAPVVSVAQMTPAAAPTPVPVSHPDFSSMTFLLGSWTCTQPLRGKTRSETDVYTMSPDGMWMIDSATAPPFDQYRTVAQNSMTQHDVRSRRSNSGYRFITTPSADMRSSPRRVGKVTSRRGAAKDWTAEPSPTSLPR